jgi:glycosyltransferase involved in cell wall biosynthesis
MKNSDPLVSSVITFLNAEKFIEEAIESVFAQTYDNWELLLVDDGSTDDSTQIALQYTQQYPEKVRYLEHPGHQNLGISASRNVGISQAKGMYIGFLDADDVWLEHKLEQQVAILNSHPEVGMLYGSSLYWYSWTGNPEDSQRDFRDFVEDCGIKPNALIEPPELLHVFLRANKLRYKSNMPCVFGSIPAPSTILVRHEVARSVGGFEEESHRDRGQYDDQFFYVKVGLETPVFAAGECWVKYRQHVESITYIERKANRHLSARLFFLNWIAEYMFKREIENVETWKLLQEEQLRTHNRQLRKLERALVKERQEVRRLRKRSRSLMVQIQDMCLQSQDKLRYKTQRLLKVLGHLWVKVLGR